MAGRIDRIDCEVCPTANGEIRYGIYEWRPAGIHHPDDFCIRFLSPEGEAPPRIFHIQPVYRHWQNGQTTRFLDSACAAGYRVLQLLGEHEPRSAYEVAQALFRNRNAGHHRVKRQFTCAADFIDVRPGQEPSVLAPGFHENANRRPGKSNYIHAVATELLRDALHGIYPSQALNVGFREITSAYARLANSERGRTTPSWEETSSSPWHKLPLYSTLDPLFTDGVYRASEWDWNKASAKVRSALIFGPVSDEDFEAAVADKPRFRLFFENVLRSVESRNESAFDRWLKNAREHQYLALVGSSRAKGDKKEEAVEQARRIACAWMWLSYQLMARCYGALMMTVLVDFCLNSQLALTIEEKWLFRQMYFPQLYLAGLPVDFLGKAQLRCIFLELRERWLNLIYEPTAYDSLTDMLGWFGLLIRDRRRADRQRKAEEAGHRPILSSADVLENHTIIAPRTPELDGATKLPWLAEPRCPKCLSPLNLIYGTVGRLDESTLCATFYCGGLCDRESTYRLNENLWRSIAQQKENSTNP